MTLNTRWVRAVLLPDGKWYRVQDKSLSIAPRDYVHEGRTNIGGDLPGGDYFWFVRELEEGEDPDTVHLFMMGPVSSILAYSLDAPPTRDELLEGL